MSIGAMHAIIRQKLLPPRLYLKSVVNFDSLYGTYNKGLLLFLLASNFYEFSVKAEITYLRVNKDLLISIASLSCVVFVCAKAS